MEFLKFTTQYMSINELIFFEKESGSEQLKILLFTTVMWNIHVCYYNKFFNNKEICEITLLKSWKKILKSELYNLFLNKKLTKISDSENYYWRNFCGL